MAIDELSLTSLTGTFGDTVTAESGLTYSRPLPKLSHVGPQLPVAVGPTGLDEARWGVLVVDDEPNELVHCEPAVQVGHGAFKRPRILPAARRLRFHSLCLSIQ